MANVAVWAVTCAYVEGQLVDTSEFVAMGCIEVLCRGAVGGHL